MVALISSFLVGMVGIGAILWYGRRREIGAGLTWGEAIAGSTFAFFLMFWWYGVIPHQWLTWSGNELNWRPDALLFQPGDWNSFLDDVLNFVLPGSDYEFPGTLPPFTMSKETVAHIIVTVIYGVALGAHVFLFMWWQGRGQRREKALATVPTSRYGRPLVRTR
ncbi:MAG: hypothetical protein ACRD29_17595 [Acidimicrobiales bacterium]